MPLASPRLLGFAFASADLLIEVSPAGDIAFAMGASEALSGSAETDLVGRPWREFIHSGDVDMVDALFEGLQTGLRGGPIVARLAMTAGGATRAVSMSVFRLPENGGAISCALSHANVEGEPASGELADRRHFEETTAALLQTAQATGADLELALVEMSGLESVREEAPPHQREALERRVAGVLRAQSHRGAAATQLDAEKFALVRARGEPTETMVKRVARLMDLGLGHGIKPAAEAIPLSGENPRQALKALRYSLDSFLREGLAGLPPTNLAEALSRSMQRTLDEVGALGAAIREKRFKLVYQPVVTLNDGQLHHYETLVRFGDQESPFPLIRMAEEMDLIEPLDIAILERAVEMVASKPDLRLAVNVSGRTIGSDDFVEHACKLLARHKDARGQILFELTESSALEDLPSADRRLKALRDQGCEICLDDFGSGAASFAYLQQLSLDVLKIDGRYIRDLQRGGREASFVKHLVRLCGELNIRTLAEMVETAEAEAVVREAGVDMAQGWLYGAAGAEPDWQPRPEKAVKVAVRPAVRR